jgi:uncharacterized protein (TIGR00369 family)
MRPTSQAGAPPNTRRSHYSALRVSDPSAAQINASVAGFDRLYGLTVEEVSAERASAHVVVGDHLRQPYGLVHGGVYATVAESLASLATALAVAGDGNLAMGLSNSTNFLRPMTEGRIHAVATRRHAGRTTWIWDVECRDDEQRLCAITRMTVAVRPAQARVGDRDATPPARPDTLT